MTLPIIEYERIRRGMSKADLARYLGVAVSTLRNWQRGFSEMPLSKIIFLAQEWNCSIDYLLGITNKTA